MRDICLDDNKVTLYELEVEGAEDFSLIFNGEYESLHQVKSGTVDLKDNDKFTFIISLLQCNVNKGYYHISKNLSLDSDFIELAKSLTYEMILTVKETELCSDSIAIYKKLGILNSDGTKVPKYKKGSLAAIYEYTSKASNRDEMHNMKIDSIKQVLLKIENELLETYPEKFDNSLEVESICKELIKNIICKKNTSFASVANDGTHIDYFFRMLYCEVKKEITKQYINKQQINKSAKIPFKKLMEIIMTDYNEVLKSSGKASKINQIDKNTSAIYAIKLDDLNRIKEIRNLIYAIEESPNYFKRYILPYTENQVCNFNRIVIDNKDKLLEILLSEICADVDEYEKLSKGQNTNSLYEFCIRLFAKVPFLKYNFQATGIQKSVIDSVKDEVNTNTDTTLMSYLELINNKKCDLDVFMKIEENIFTDSDIEQELEKLLKE